MTAADDQARSPDPEERSPAGWHGAAARAKVNLRLRIFPPRADGYHPVETILCRIDLADRLRLRLREEPGVALRVTGPEPAPAGRENLAVRAAESVLRRSGTSLGVEIELEKRVPAGTGLGGGSSDAGAVIRTLVDLLELPDADESASEIAGELGSDVAFFAAGMPFALAWGRGDRLLTLPAPMTRPLALLLPELHSSTAAAYAAWDELSRKHPPVGPPVLAWRQVSSWAGLAELAVNDFEPVLFQRFPKLRALRSSLDRTAPEIALLTGSGSGLFGVYRDERERDRAARRLSGELAGTGVRVVSACGPV